MEAIEISAERRTTSGKGSNRKLRSAGRVPAIMYGKGLDVAVSVSLCPRELGKALSNPKKHNALFQINLGDEETPVVLVREIQRDPVSRAILHVDLMSPDLQKGRTVSIPIRFSGKSKGVALGGRLQMPYRDLRVFSLPENIPAEVVVDVTDMDIGDAVMVSALTLPADVTAIYDDDYVVAKVLQPRGGPEGEGQEGEEEAAEGAEGEGEAAEASEG
jgi:large subunit ribosomal protein L25